MFVCVHTVARSGTKTKRHEAERVMLRRGILSQPSLRKELVWLLKRMRIRTCHSSHCQDARLDRKMWKASYCRLIAFIGSSGDSVDSNT